MDIGRFVRLSVVATMIKYVHAEPETEIVQDYSHPGFIFSMVFLLLLAVWCCGCMGYACYKCVKGEGKLYE